VNAQAKKGESPEESARKARYQALEKIITKNASLFFAQHRQDQVETVLLQLFRGAGLKGLSGMPESTGIGKGQLLRPLLDTRQEAIICYANQHHLQWIEDPSNQDDAYDRNYLRQKILPLVEQRWKGFDKAIFRSARHCSQAQRLLANIAKSEMLTIYDSSSQSLNIAELLLKEIAQQQWIIREWMAYLNLRMPSKKVLQSILVDVLLAREDANPIIQHEACTIRRYQKRLYAVLDIKNPVFNSEVIWQDVRQDLYLTDNSKLQLVAAQSGIANHYFTKGLVEIKYRAGGEHIALAHRSGRHSLKKLYQEAKIPPWKRKNIPLIYIDGKFAAVANLWISAEFHPEEGEQGLKIIWQEPTIFD
jgi:tRNA(Ile)-lysidine synthase